MLCMLVTVYKAHGVTWITRIVNNILKTLVMQKNFRVSYEIGPTFPTCYLTNESIKVGKKNFF